MAGNSLSNCLSSVFSPRGFITGCTVLFLTAFPIAQITIGAVRIYECPAAPFIPVYVVVCGILGLLFLGVIFLPKRLCPRAESNILWTLWVAGLVLFTLIWFIYGSYQIYSVYPPNYTKTPMDPHSNNSSYTPTTPDSKPDLVSQKQNKSFPNFNDTWMINNQTLMNVIQTLAFSNISTKTNREHLNTPQAHGVMAAAPYCDRSLYLFVFWVNTFFYALTANALVITGCIYCFMFLSKLVTA